MDAKTTAGTLKVLGQIRDQLQDMYDEAKHRPTSDKRSGKEGFETGLFEARLVAQKALRQARWDGVEFSEKTIMGRDREDLYGINIQLDNAYRRLEKMKERVSQDPEYRLLQFSLGRAMGLEHIMSIVKHNIHALEVGWR